MRILVVSSDEFGQGPHNMRLSQRSFAGPVRGEMVAVQCSEDILPVTFVSKVAELGCRWLTVRCRCNLHEISEAPDDSKIKKCQVMPDRIGDGIRCGDSSASAECVV